MVTLNRAHALQARSSASSKIRSGVVLTLLLTDLSFTASRCLGQFSAVGLISGIWGKKLGEESIIHSAPMRRHFCELSSPGERGYRAMTDAGESHSLYFPEFC